LWYHIGTTPEAACFGGKKTISSKIPSPSAALREQASTTVNGRGFRSEQVFLIDACEHEIREDANTEATAYFQFP